MWSQPRSEFSLAPTLGYLALGVVAGLFIVDGDLQALSARLTRGHEAAVPAAALAGGAIAGPSLGGRLAAEEQEEDEIEEPPPGAAAVALAPADESRAEVAGGSEAAAPLLFVPCIDGASAACRKDALADLRARLAAARAGTLGRPLRLSMFGDSVVATDEIPGRLRQRMVAELGDGGPGFIYAQAPHRFCSHGAMTRGSAGTWSTYAISTSSIRDHLYGFGGSTAQTASGSVTVRVRGEPITRVAVHYLAQPRGGALSVFADDGATPITTASSLAEAPAARVEQVSVENGARKITVRADGVVRYFGLVLERDKGAVVDNLGIVSVNSKNFVRNASAHWTEAVRARSPDLVLVMIGANEAQWLSGGRDEMSDYSTRFAALLAPIRQGGAGCVVISPLDQVEVKDDAIVSRKVAPRMAEAQRRAAAEVGCAFFDTYRWMGGAGSALRWRRRGLLGGDYIHLTKKGADKLGDALYAELLGQPPGGAAP